VLLERRIECDVEQSALSAWINRGQTGHRLRHLLAVRADDAQPSRPLGDQHLAIGQKRQAPRACEPLGTGDHRDRHIELLLGRTRLAGKRRLLIGSVRRANVEPVFRTASRRSAAAAAAGRCTRRRAGRLLSGHVDRTTERQNHSDENGSLQHRHESPLSHEPVTALIIDYRASSANARHRLLIGDQYRLFSCRIKSNFAVSATAITAITPACTGSLTTRSAASGTLPAMLSEITLSPMARTSSTAVAMSPPISAPASTSIFTRGSRPVARTAAASSCSLTSGIVSTEMRSPRMLWRSASVIAPIAT